MSSVTVQILRRPFGAIETRYSGDGSRADGMLERLDSYVVEMDHLRASEPPDAEYIAELLRTAFRNGALWARQNPYDDLR